MAVNAILVLHVGKTGRRTVGRTPLRLHVPPGATLPWTTKTSRITVTACIAELIVKITAGISVTAVIAN